ADPGEAPEPNGRALGDLELEVATEEDRAIGLPAPARRRQEAPPEITPVEPRVAPIEHAVAAQEAEEPEHGAESRNGRRAPVLDSAAPWPRRPNPTSPSASSPATSGRWRARSR